MAVVDAIRCLGADSTTKRGQPRANKDVIPLQDLTVTTCVLTERCRS